MKHNVTGSLRFLLMGLATIGCLQWGCEEQQQAAGPPQARVLEVTYIITEEEPLVLNTELPGRTSAYQVAEVRPQVTGIIQSRLFEQGQDVKAGDVLYEIDSARYEAIYNRAKASLEMAKAELPALQSRVDRYKSAVSERAVSQQAFDESVSALNHALATVTACEADLQSAQIDLDYTRIKAPISGRIGRSSITVGALATANQPQPLATIHKFDPVYVDVMQSSVELLRLRDALKRGELKINGSQQTVKLRLEDGTIYSEDGTLQFRDVSVDPTTGSYTLRAVFPNPNRHLLPGMFVRAIVQEGVKDDAILIPQQCVTRTPKGEPVVLVVKDDNTLEQRLLVLDRAIGSQWLIDSGLSAGEKVVMEGMNARGGMTVHAVPYGDNPASQQAHEGSQTAEHK